MADIHEHPYKRFDTPATIAADDYAYNLACQLDAMWSDPKVSRLQYWLMERRVKQATERAIKVRWAEISK